MSDKETAEQNKEIRVTTKLQDEDLVEAKENINRLDKLRSDSGNVEFADTLTTFFYLLLRDYIPAGKVEMLVNEVITGPETVLFTNGFLANYADSLANLLKNARVRTLEDALSDAFSDGILPKLEDKKEDAKAVTMNDPTVLSELKEKVDHAIENMSEDEKEEFVDRVVRIEEDIKSTEQQEETRKLETQNKNEYRESIATSLSALENLKELIPTDTIKQVAEILKSEVESELSDEAKEDIQTENIQTRESIYKKRAEENKEHQATNEEAKQAAVEYVKEQVEDALTGGEVKTDPEDKMSRGNLENVASGHAFPEALDKMFDEDKGAEGAELKQAEEVGKAMEDIRSEKNPEVSQRTE